MKRIVVLGSTGSIGTQTLDIVRQFPEQLRVVGLAAARNASLLAEQAADLGVERTVLYERDGMAALVDLATLPEADVVVISVAGVIGLEPTIAAIRAGKHIALASKEVLVAAGEVVMPLVRRHGVTMTPIDSEHSAIFQCLQGVEPAQIGELILTASGGPFRGMVRDQLRDITAAQALQHPTWSMGGKITIDSATLMNKGLEMIEAKWLFDVPIERVEAVIHPQSIVHSFVRLTDGSVLGQLGWPNMRLPIAYALLYPERRPNELPRWNPVDTPHLTFEPVDLETFRCLGLARRSAELGGTAPCALNAANEVAVAAFLEGRLSFLGIDEVVERVLEAHAPLSPTLESLLSVDAEARVRTHEAIRATLVS